MSDARLWLAIERTCHDVKVRPVGGMYTSPEGREVRAVCRCGWRGRPHPPEKAGTWAVREGREHLAEVETRVPPVDWPADCLAP